MFQLGLMRDDEAQFRFLPTRVGQRVPGKERRRRDRMTWLDRTDLEGEVAGRSHSRPVARLLVDREDCEEATWQQVVAPFLVHWKQQHRVDYTQSALGVVVAKWEKSCDRVGRYPGVNCS